MRRAWFACAALCVLPLAGCTDKANEPFHDAQRESQENRNPATVGTMPDGFSNYASKCDHGNRLYVAFHGDSPYASLAVVAADPSCKGQE